MVFQPRFGIQPCLSVGIFYSGLYLLENIILFSKPYYYIMFWKACKVLYFKIGILCSWLYWKIL